MPALPIQIDQALAKGLLPNSNLKPEKLADFYKTNSLSKANTDSQYHAFQRIMYNALHRGWGFVSAIENAEKKLCASCFFLYSQGRVLCLLPAANQQGRDENALALLLDLFIRSQAGKPVILDFNTALSDWPEALPHAFGAKEVRAWRLSK